MPANSRWDLIRRLRVNVAELFVVLQEGGEGGAGAATSVGDYEPRQHDGGSSRTDCMGICPLVLLDTFSDLIPRILHCVPLLLPQRRGE